MFKTEPLYSSTPASGSSNKNLNNLLADDDEPQAEPPGLIQQILSFFSKLWSPSTSDAEKLGYSYVYAEDGSLLGEYGSGGSNSTGTAQYLYLPTASGPMPIAAVIKGQTYAVHSDHLNTPRKLTQPDGQVAWQWAYSAFGDEQPTTGGKRFTNETTNPTTGATSIPEVTFNLRYPGQYFDKETKLHYNYFRSYNALTDTYTQNDPSGLMGGWNRRVYANANPLLHSDPLGLNSMERQGSPRLPLTPMHPDSSLSKASLDYWSRQPTSDILKSLQPGLPEGLKVDPATGKIWDGNTRIKVLSDRGVNINELPRESYRPGGGMGLRCVGVLGAIGLVLDAAAAIKWEMQCKKDPCSCDPRCS